MRYISRSEAASIHGVSIEAIRHLSRKWEFWGGADGNEIDIDHPDWKAYCKGKRKKKAASVKTGQTKERKTASRVKTGQKKAQKKNVKSRSGKAKGKKNENGYDPEHAITGGIDLSKFKPGSITEVNKYIKAYQMNVEIHARLGDLIDRRIVESKMQEIGILIQSHFVDQARRLSGKICAKLQRIGMERKVEEIISKDVQNGIQAIKNSVIKKI